MILDDIMKFRREQLARERAVLPESEIEKMALSRTEPTKGFKAAISAQGINIISEVKKASPSKGLISPDFRPVEVAAAYQKSGAAAISVLTEEHYFMGSSVYLSEIRQAVNIPILRKDFIFDPYQIYEARALGADAVLLIAALLGPGEMRALRELAESLGMDVLCESHNEGEVRTCVEAGASIFGINNRDLRTFEVNLETTGRLAALLPEGAVVVSESGMFTAGDVLRAYENGANAVLIGESLMRDPSLLGGIRERLRGNRNEA